MSPTDSAISIVPDDESFNEDYVNPFPGVPKGDAPPEPARGFVWLDELASLPHMLEPPKVVIPRIALSGRVTLLAAAEKVGKSTLMGQAIAALTTGDTFLGRPCLAGKAVWMGLDEPITDCAIRLVDHGAIQQKIAIVEDRPSWHELYDILDATRPSVLVIDTLTEWAVGQVGDLNSAQHWTPFLKTMRDHIARKRDIAIVLLHHMTKQGRGYADSRAIGAGVDIILEMDRHESDENQRIVRYRGRGVGSGSFRMDFVQQKYQLTGSGWNKEKA